VTEWFDDTDPPEHKLDREDLGLAWSQLYPGVRIRFKTTLFVRRGTITWIKKRSMKVRFDGFPQDTSIPDAKWYWVQAKMGNMNEHMVAIDPGILVTHSQMATELLATPDDDITPAEAANIIGTDSKVVRRMIRSGVLPARRNGGRWILKRSDALAHRR
jgi:excisionase family DNA binding protein